MKINEYITMLENPLGSADYEPFTNDFMPILIDYVKFNHGNLQIRPTLEDSVDQIPDLVSNMYRVKKYQYTKLWGTTKLEYNPIENYSMSESGNDTTSISTTNVKGQQTDTAVLSNNTTLGGQTTTHGSTTTNNTSELSKSGAEDNTHKSVPYDTDTEVLTNKDTLTFTDRKDKQTNVTTTDEYTDTIGNRTDTAEQNGTSVSGDRTDTSNSSTSTTHTFTRSGNIGVTTSQQMLQSERDIAMFNFMAIVAHDIIKLITICIYD